MCSRTITFYLVAPIFIYLHTVYCMFKGLGKVEYTVHVIVEVINHYLFNQSHYLKLTFLNSCAKHTGAC